MKNLRALGINVNKGYERKRKILESEVTSEGATKGINIDDLTAIILSEEQRLNTDPTRLVVDSSGNCLPMAVGGVAGCLLT